MTAVNSRLREKANKRRLGTALILGVLVLGSACSDDDPDPLVASIEVDKTQVSTGEGVQFSDISEGDPVSWFWTFEGGSPSTSNLQNPLVTYSAPGVFDVTLRVANEVDTIEVLREEFISVALELAEITGAVQKGPYLNGGQIRLRELDSNLNAIDELSSNIGTLGVYSFQNVVVSSGIVELQATGAYFNEVSGANSESTLTMSALVDLTDRTAFNVNMLTTLEVERIKKLVQEGLTFESAKNQAQEEVLNIFEITLSSIDRSEYLTIAEDGDANAALLAISSILQGTRTTTDVSELVADIAADIASDGVLDDEELGSQLINEADIVDAGEVRSNLEEVYSEVSGTVIPDFEAMVSRFRKKSDFELTKQITYPVSGIMGSNILDQERTAYREDRSYSFIADLPSGTELKVVLQSLGGVDWFWGVPNGGGGWDVTKFDSEKSRQVFTSNTDGIIDIRISFRGTSRVSIKYFENGSETPTFSKNIKLSTK